MYEACIAEGFPCHACCRRDKSVQENGTHKTVIYIVGDVMGVYSIEIHFLHDLLFHILVI